MSRHLDSDSFARSLCNKPTKRASDCDRSDTAVFLVECTEGGAAEDWLNDGSDTACQTQVCKLSQSTQETLTCITCRRTSEVLQVLRSQAVSAASRPWH